MKGEEWKICFKEYEAEKEKLREALCTLANGYIGLRGSIPYASDKVSYKGFYCSGLYNKLKTRLGKNLFVENEDLVNLPDWTFFKFGLEENKVLEVDNASVIGYRQELDMKSGRLKRRITFEDKKGKKTTVEEERIVSMANKHLAALKIRIIPENWEGVVHVKSGIDGSVRNLCVERYNQLVNKHLKVLEKGVEEREEESKIYLVSQTSKSRVLIVEAVKQSCRCEGRVEKRIRKEKEKVYEVIKANASKSRPLVLEKILAFFTSRDAAVSDPLSDALEELDNVKDFNEVFEESKRVWESLWDAADIEIEPKSREQKLLRFNIFHLLQVVNRNLAENDAGIPARGLHGEAYRGHVFWDEMFIFPIICLKFPDTAREVLKYRYRRLEAARENARRMGLKGAMFPWQSASKGDETTPKVHLNPISGRWLNEETQLQRHVNLAIAFNFWKYFETTHDYNFLYNYAAETILEISRGMASLCSYNPGKKRWEIKGLMGPDEYHSSYPGAKKPGINNNAYTNLMTVWLFSTALKMISMMPKQELARVKKKIGLRHKEVLKWEKIMKKMFVPFISPKIIEQFEGYRYLKEFDFKTYERKYGDIRRADRVLEAEGDSTNNYKISKQADALMLFYLFSAEELERLFRITGYKFDPGIIPETIKYYLKRTVHGSSLSFSVHSWVLSRLDREGSWEFFTKTLDIDFGDLSKTTHEGIHLGAMAGSADIVHRCYTGLEFREGKIVLNPLLPKELKRIITKIYYRGGWIGLDIRKRKVNISLDSPEDAPVEIEVKGKRIVLRKSGRTTVRI